MNIRTTAQAILGNLSQWRTTALGLVILSAAIASVFTSGLSWSEASIGIMLGLTLCFSPDTIVSRTRKWRH